MANEPEETPALVTAAGQGDVPRMAALLDAGESPDTVYRRDLEERSHAGSYTRTLLLPALHAAVSSGSIEAVRLLLERGANREALDEERQTAVVRAVDAGHEGIVRLFLDYGADLDARDGSGCPVMRQAAAAGHAAIVRLLLERGADPEAQGPVGGTALMAAAERGHVEVVRLLLESGADPMTRRQPPLSGNSLELKRPGDTAFTGAASQGHTDVLRLLGERVETDEYGRALIEAARDPSGVEAVRFLLGRGGVDINARDRSGDTALYGAVRFGSPESARLLLAAGADPNLTYTYRRLMPPHREGVTALMVAAGRGSGPLTELLLHSGARIDMANEQGWTALWYAVNARAVASHEKDDPLRLLLERGSDPNAPNREGLTLLSYLRSRREALQPLIGAARVEEAEALLLAAGATE
jgi:ankyrin repeat protein